MLKKIALFLGLLILLAAGSLILLEFTGAFSPSNHLLPYAARIPGIGPLLVPELEDELEVLRVENEQLQNVISDLEDQLKRAEVLTERREREIRQLTEEAAGLREEYDRLVEDRRKRAERMRKLAALYSTMRADDAAEILMALDVDLVVDILAAMEDRAAARILGGLDSDRAAVITNRMAE